MAEDEQREKHCSASEDGRGQKVPQPVEVDPKRGKEPDTEQPPHGEDQDCQGERGHQRVRLVNEGSVCRHRWLVVASDRPASALLAIDGDLTALQLLPECPSHRESRSDVAGSQFGGMMEARARGADSEIALVGLWHLGSVAAAGWISTGTRVTCWDPDPGLRSSIGQGHGPVVEPGVDAALVDGLHRGVLQVADEPPFAEAPITHLTFDTATGPSGVADDARLDAVVDEFAMTAQSGALLLVSSQLPVGTCRRWRTRLAVEDRGLLLAHVPENLRLGQALNDFMEPERMLIGADDDAAFEIASSALARFSASPMRLTLASAEMAKHATNAYLAVCIAFANDLAWLSLKAGADPTEVAAALRADSRVSPSAPLRPGSAFSGATLLRDLVTLRDLGEECGRPELFEAVLHSNERHSEVVLTWLRDPSVLWPGSGSPPQV